MAGGLDYKLDVHTGITSANSTTSPLAAKGGWPDTDQHKSYQSRENWHSSGCPARRLA